MSKRRLVITAVLAGESQSEVARRYGVSQPWISRLMARHRREGEAAFEPRSRRPRTSPNAIPPQTVELVLVLRKELADQGLDAIEWARRAEQRSAAFQERYRRRAGIEATLSALVRRGGRRSRYRGRKKTLFQYAATASAINLKRVAAHRAGVPVVRSRAARLRRLMGEEGARAKGWGQNLRAREGES